MTYSDENPGLSEKITEISERYVELGRSLAEKEKDEPDRIKGALKLIDLLKQQELELDILLKSFEKDS